MMIIKYSRLLHAIGFLEFDELFILIGYGMTMVTTIFAGNLAIRTSFVANFNSHLAWVTLGFVLAVVSKFHSLIKYMFHTFSSNDIKSHDRS